MLYGKGLDKGLALRGFEVLTVPAGEADVWRTPPQPSAQPRAK
mgnify:CR=1 FL=1